jgi:hypothetical protein
MANGNLWASVGKWSFALLFTAVLVLWVAVAWTALMAYGLMAASDASDNNNYQPPTLGGAMAVGTAIFLMGLVPVGALLAGANWFWKEAPMRQYLIATAMAAVVQVVGLITVAIMLTK